MTKLILKNKAIYLRTKGYSYSYIKKKLQISKSTLSDWLCNIPYSPNEYTAQKIGKARLASGAQKHQIKIKSLEVTKIQAEKDIGDISKRDLMMLGLGIYIGEGCKTNDVTRIVNSDPRVIKLMINWFKLSFDVELKQIKVRLYLYPDSNEKHCINYWSKEIGIPINQFFKSVIDRRTDKKTKKAGKLPFGTAHVSIKSFGNKKHGVYLNRLIMAWIKRVL